MRRQSFSERVAVPWPALVLPGAPLAAPAASLLGLGHQLGAQEPKKALKIDQIYTPSTHFGTQCPSLGPHSRYVPRHCPGTDLEWVPKLGPWVPN